MPHTCAGMGAQQVIAGPAQVNHTQHRTCAAKDSQQVIAGPAEAYNAPSTAHVLQKALSRSLLALQGLTVLQRGTWCASV